MGGRIKIFPSIAAGNLLRLAEEIKKLEDAGADGIHFDAMDGHFVPLLTLGVPVLEQLRKITSLHLDVHIMVSNPDVVFRDYLKAGADTLTFQIETAIHAHKICAEIQQAGKRAGIALNPATHWNTLEYLLPELDQVTIMTVNPGFSRQQHLSFVHKKIRDLAIYRHQHQLNFTIMVDGGVNAENAPLLFSLGANSVVAGGAVFRGEDYRKNISEILSASLVTPSAKI